MKQLAIMKGIHFGVRDKDWAMLWFEVYVGESYSSLICLPSKYAINLIEEHKITDIKNLEGKPCWVFIDGNSVTFVDLAKI